MGIGDQIIATGLARGAWKKRGVQIAFGSGRQLRWDRYSEMIFRRNPNIAFPGFEHRRNVEWVEYYKGKRGYNKQGKDCWIWNMDWRCVPGEFYFAPEEEQVLLSKQELVLFEPNVEDWKPMAPNKRWPFERYQEVADRLVTDGYEVAQFDSGIKAGPRLRRVKQIVTCDFRQAAAVMKKAVLYVGTEGGLHHAAAALNVPAVVLFGGFIPPSVTGYNMHKNLVGSDRFCGSLQPCKHCTDALNLITVDEVYNAAKELLSR